MIPKILYVGPIRDFSGYATAARNYVRALNDSGCNLATRALRYDGGNTPMSAVEKTLNNKDINDVDIVLCHTTPNEQEIKEGVFNCCYFAWETDRVPDEWVKQLNKMDLIMVPCDDNILACRVAGVKPPVVKVPHTFDVNYYRNAPAKYDMHNFDGYFKFLSICQLSKKKGVDALIFAYLNEFKAKDKTLLILKVYVNPNDSDAEKNIIAQNINEIKASLRLKEDEYPRIQVIHGVSDEDVIKKLYKTADCYVLPSRGEGWGIPHFDALGFGLPSIGLKWGGTREFINNKNGWLVDYTMQPCHSMPHPHNFMYTANDNWAEPDILSLRKAMREAFIEWSIDKVSKDELSAWQTRKNNALATAKLYDHSVVGPHMRDVIYGHYNAWRELRGH